MRGGCPVQGCLIAQKRKSKSLNKVIALGIKKEGVWGVGQVVHKINFFEQFLNQTYLTETPKHWVAGLKYLLRLTTLFRRCTRRLIKLNQLIKE